MILTFQSLNTSLMLRHNQQRSKTLSSHIAQRPEWETLRQKAFVIYTNVKEELGNWKTRKDNTFTKVVPKKQKSNT